MKSGHTIYVTVNSPSSPTFANPDDVDNSRFREAEAKLSAMGFQLTEPQRVVGEKDWVYGIICRGRRVSNDDRIPIDHPLTLIIGTGTYENDELEEVDDYTDFDANPTDGMEDISDDMDDYEEVTAP